MILPGQAPTNYQLVFIQTKPPSPLHFSAFRSLAAAQPCSAAFTVFASLSSTLSKQYHHKQLDLLNTQRGVRLSCPTAHGEPPVSSERKDPPRGLSTPAKRRKAAQQQLLLLIRVQFSKAVVLARTAHLGCARPYMNIPSLLLLLCFSHKWGMASHIQSPSQKSSRVFWRTIF